MSTRAKNAYRLRRPGELWGLSQDIQVWGRREARNVLRKLYEDVAKHVDTRACEEYSNGLRYYEGLGKENAAAAARLYAAHALVMDAYKKQLHEPYRSPYDFRAMVVVHRHRRNIYLCAIEGDGMRGVLSFLGADARLAEYSYDSSTDRPKEVSPQEWLGRGKVWSEIESRVRAGVYTVVPVVGSDNFADVDPFHADFEQEARKP